MRRVRTEYCQRLVTRTELNRFQFRIDLSAVGHRLNGVWCSTAVPTITDRAIRQHNATIRGDFLNDRLADSYMSDRLGRRYRTLNCRRYISQARLMKWYIEQLTTNRRNRAATELQYQSQEHRVGAANKQVLVRAKSWRLPPAYLAIGHRHHCELRTSLAPKNNGSIGAE